RAFERGEIRLDVICVMIVTVVANLAVVVLWLHPGRERAMKWGMTVVVLIAASVVTPVAAELRRSWDVSEDHRNSFSREDEQALARIHEPLLIEVNLSPEDPRLADLDREVLRKLRRVLPELRVVNTSQSM